MDNTNTSSGKYLAEIAFVPGTLASEIDTAALSLPVVIPASAGKKPFYLTILGFRSDVTTTRNSFASGSISILPSIKGVKRSLEDISEGEEEEEVGPSTYIPADGSPSKRRKGDSTFTSRIPLPTNSLRRSDAIPLDVFSPETSSVVPLLFSLPQSSGAREKNVMTAIVQSNETTTPEKRELLDLLSPRPHQNHTDSTITSRLRQKKSVKKTRTPSKLHTPSGIQKLTPKTVSSAPPASPQHAIFRDLGVSLFVPTTSSTLLDGIASNLIANPPTHPETLQSEALMYNLVLITDHDYIRKRHTADLKALEKAGYPKSKCSNVKPNLSADDEHARRFPGYVFKTRNPEGWEREGKVTLQEAWRSLGRDAPISVGNIAVSSIDDAIGARGMRRMCL